MSFIHIQELIIFKTVVKHKSISKAAQELNFVQSTVTTKIQRLEAHFQTELFYRHRYGVTLTPHGKTLLAYANELIHLSNEAEKAMMENDVTSGPISIGSMETTAAVRLPSALSIFHQTYPDVELSLQTGPTDQLVKMVLNYEIDGAFVAGPIKNVHLTNEKIIEERLVVISPYENKHLDVNNSNLLVFRHGCSYRKRLEAWIHHENYVPKKIMEFGSMEAIIGCVNAGMGISLLPLSVLQKVQDNYSLRFHEIPKEYGITATYFVQRKDATTTLAIKKLIETVKRELVN